MELLIWELHQINKVYSLLINKAVTVELHDIKDNF